MFAMFNTNVFKLHIGDRKMLSNTANRYKHNMILYKGKSEHDMF